MQTISQEQLKSLLHYNQDTGIFTWITSPTKNIRAGATAGYIHKTGYCKIRINKKAYLSHRLAWLYTYGEYPQDQLDHRNRDRTDNRIVNLREVTNQENQKNRSKSKNNTSGVNGVSFHKKSGKWRATIKVNSKSIHLGLFPFMLSAMIARTNAEIENGFIL